MKPLLFTISALFLASAAALSAAQREEQQMDAEFIFIPLTQGPYGVGDLWRMTTITISNVYPCDGCWATVLNLYEFPNGYQNFEDESAAPQGWHQCHIAHVFQPQDFIDNDGYWKVTVILHVYDAKNNLIFQDTHTEHGWVVLEVRE